MKKLMIITISAVFFFGVSCGKTEDVVENDETVNGEDGADEASYEKAKKDTDNSDGWYELEDIEMGEAGDVSYRAVPSEEPGAFDIQKKTSNSYETIAEVFVPDADGYDAGVSPDGDYYYLAGSIYGYEYPKDEGDEREGFIYVYSIIDPENRFVEFASEEANCFTGDVVFDKQTLYVVMVNALGDVLYEIDMKTGGSTKIADECDIDTVHPVEGYYVAMERFEGIGKLFPPNTSCVCHSDGGYRKYLRVDLDNGEVTELSDASTTSTLTEEGKPTDYLGANKAIDCDISTAWVEDIDGPGIGEKLTVNFGRSINITNFGILPGFAKSPGTYTSNNRLKKARVDFSDGTSFEVSFKDKMALNKMLISDYAGGEEGISATWMSITILDVYPGSRWDDTCISEVTWNIAWDTRWQKTITESGDVYSDL